MADSAGDDTSPDIQDIQYQTVRARHPPPSDIPTLGDETSFRMYLKKRAPGHYVGFVDAESMAPTSDYSNRGVKLFNHLVNTPVPGSSEFLQESMEKQLEYLNHSKHGPFAKQLLMTETLPNHDFNINIGTITDCLSADCRAVRRDAASRLERLVLVTNHTFIQACKTQLLRLAQKTYDIIHDDRCDVIMKDKEHLRVCGHLHLLAMSALLCRSQNRPTITECRPLMTWPKPNRKQGGNDVRQEILKTMHAFYDCFERHLKDPRLKMTAVSDLKKFIKADLCDQLSFLFSLLNQIGEEEWSDKTLELLGNLKQVCDVIVKDGKRLKPEVKSGIDTVLVRSLVVLLSFTFAKVRQVVGPDSYDHPVLAARMLVSIARTVQPQPLQDFLPQLSVIAFHESPKVRLILTELMDDLRRPHLHTALDYLQASLGVADFHIEPPKKVEDVCSWYKLKGDFGRQVDVDCHVLIHTGQCKGKRSSSGQCVDHPSEDEDWQRKKHNMQMLVKLGACNQGSQMAGMMGACGQGLQMAGRKKVRKHEDCIAQLHAFQNSPFLFYAMESIQGRRLLEELINHRAAHRWLSTSVLSRVMHDVISGLQFLANRKIASREIATYYLLVGGKSRRGGVASQRTDILTMEDCTVKLASLELSHQFRAEGGRRNSLHPVHWQGPIPLLWTPPEALLRGEYSEQSMVYSAGCVMYELWTHGCQPFTTYQIPTTDAVLRMLQTPDSMPLLWWPCIPEAVFKVMKKCTAWEPSDRPNLASLKLTFMEMTRNTAHEETGAFTVEGKEQDYPSFSDDQVRRTHVPVLGIPPVVQQIIDEYKKNRNDSYKNMGCPPPGPSMSTELPSPYWIEYAYLQDFTCVREKLSSGFAEKELPLLLKRAHRRQDHLQAVTDWVRRDEDTLEEESPDHIVHERFYKPAWTLQDVVCKGMLATTESGYMSMALERHLHVLLSLARALHALHQERWLHRDIRAANILVDCQTGEITLARLGRMCQMPASSGCVRDEPFQDSWRWLGPEVLSDGEYTRQNDVFMFGTVIWELFWYREVAERDPYATEKNFLPFADQPRKKILDLVRQKAALEKPRACPDWLYQLSVNCRDPDPTMRPLTSDIILTLEGEIVQKPDPSRRFLVHPKLLVAAHEYASEDGSVPPLPARFQTRHARPFRDNSSDPTARNMADPISMRSINLELSRAFHKEPASSEAAGQYATAGDPASTRGDSGYLTPASETVQSVIAAKLQDKEKFQRRSSESDKCVYGKADFLSKYKGRSVSESELPSSGGLGLNLEPRDGAKPRDKVFRRIKVYPSGRGLPPVPAEDQGGAHGDGRDSVYDEI